MTLKNAQRGFFLNPYRFTSSMPEPVLSGLWAACSIKKLFASYTGYCLKARRESDNATLNFGFSNNLLDTSAIASWAAGSSVFVERWYDQTGAGNDFIQPTTTKQARIFNASVYDGCLYFDGSTGGMESVNSSGGPIPAITIAAKAWCRNNSSGILIEKSVSIGTENGFYIYALNADGINQLQLGCSDDSDYQYTIWRSGMSMTSSNPWVVRFDRSLSTQNQNAAWPKSWANGSEATINFLVNGNNAQYGALSREFADNKYFIGARNNSSTFAPANYESMLIYHANKDSDISTITAAL